MATATYRPTTSSADVSGGGTVTSPELAMDNDLLTYAVIKAINPGDSASANYNGFPADTDRGARAAVVLRVNVLLVVWDAGDIMYVWFRAVNTDTFTMIGSFLEADLFPGQDWVDIDITALAGTSLMTGFEASVTFANSPISEPPPPVVS